MRLLSVDDIKRAANIITSYLVVKSRNIGIKDTRVYDPNVSSCLIICLLWMAFNSFWRSLNGLTGSVNGRSIGNMDLYIISHL